MIGSFDQPRRDCRWCSAPACGKLVPTSGSPFGVVERKGVFARMTRDDDLESMLGYRIQSADLAMGVDARRVLAPHALTPAKVTALMLIRANPGCDQTALGRALSINRSSVMKLVNVLVARGLVERRPGKDLRTNALHLLPGVTELLARIVVDLNESDRRMAARLSEAERAALMTLLRKLGPGREQRTRPPKGTPPSDE